MLAGLYVSKLVASIPLILLDLWLERGNPFNNQEGEDCAPLLSVTLCLCLLSAASCCRNSFFRKKINWTAHLHHGLRKWQKGWKHLCLYEGIVTISVQTRSLWLHVLMHIIPRMPSNAEGPPICSREYYDSQWMSYIDQSDGTRGFVLLTICQLNSVNSGCHFMSCLNMCAVWRYCFYEYIDINNIK